MTSVRNKKTKVDHGFSLWPLVWTAGPQECYQRQRVRRRVELTCLDGRPPRRHKFVRPPCELLYSNLNRLNSTCFWVTSQFLHSSIRIKDVHGVGNGFGHVVQPKGPNPTCNQTLLHRAFDADSMGANYTGTRENEVKVSSSLGTRAAGGAWGAGAAVLGALGLVLV